MILKFQKIKVLNKLKIISLILLITKKYFTFVTLKYSQNIEINKGLMN